MPLYGAMAKDANLSDLTDLGKARATLGIASQISPNGNQFYVDSGHPRARDTADGGGSNTPFATLDFADTQTTANNGDIVWVLPGHAETISADGGCDLGTAGVTYVGLGSGSDRPTLTVSTATGAVISIDGANVVFHNFLVLGNFNTLVACMEIAADSVEVSHCEFREGTSSMQIAIVVGLANADADFTHIHDCKFLMNQPDVTNFGDAAISIEFDSDNITIEDNVMVGDWDLAGINLLVGGNACDFLTIRRNYIDSQKTGIWAIAIEEAGTMNSLLVHDNVLISDTPNLTAQLHTAKAWNNTPLTSPVSEPRKFYVDSNGGGADAGEGTVDYPFLTLDFAVAFCTADHGDEIHVAAGHNENLAGADGVDIDIAGIKVIGHGEGNNRPLFDLDAAASEFVIGAAGVSVENLRFRPGADAVLKAIDVEAAGVGFVIRNCNFGEAEASTDEFVDAIIVNAATHNGVIENCYFDAGAEAAASAIKLSGAVLGIIIRNNTVVGDYSAACLFGDTTASQNVIIENNTLWNGVHGGLNAVACISQHSGTTGIVQDNRLYCNVVHPRLALIAIKMMQFNNTYSEREGASGDLEPQYALRTITKTDAGVITGDDPLFVITGGSIHVVSIVGTVTTILGGAANAHLNMNVTTPSADVSMSTNVDVGSEGEGTVWTFVGPTGVLTPTDAGLVIFDTASLTLTETQWICPIGTIELTTDATRSGVISFTMTYWANSQATVTVAA